MDDLVPKQDWTGILWVALFWSLAYLIQNGLNALRIITNNKFEQKAVFDIRSELYEKIQSLPISWFDSGRTGDIMTRIIEDVTSMEKVLIDGLELGLKNILQIAIVLSIIFYTDVTIGFAVMIPLPFLIFGALSYSRNAKKRYKSQRAATSDMNSILHDNISGVKQIKTYSAEEEEHERFNIFSKAYSRATLRVMIQWAKYKPSMDFLIDLGKVIVVTSGAFALINGGLTAGEMIYLLMLISLLYEPVRALHQLNQIVVGSGAAADRVFDILDADPEKGRTHEPLLEIKEAPEVVFEKVCFQYDQKSTLSCIDLTASAGKTIAIVGPTGAGKSSLVNLIPRFYELNSGKIMIGGQDVKEVNLKSLRSNIAYVTQDSFLFNGTIKANLQLGKRDATDEEMFDALELANAYEFVSKLPDELETNIGELGVKLSGGEKQRIAIARAMLKNAPILILDEATASVDNTTEEKIQKALDNLMLNKTAFVIAHRLSTIKNADMIFVLENGSISESGTLDELLNKKGAFYQLHEASQLNATIS